MRTPQENNTHLEADMLEKLDAQKPQLTLFVCCGSACRKKGAEHLAANLAAELERCGLNGVVVRQTACQGECGSGPLVRIMPQDIVYYQVKPEDAADIAAALGGKPVKRLLLRKRAKTFEHLAQNSFYAAQTRSLCEAMATEGPFDLHSDLHDFEGLRHAQSMNAWELRALLEEAGFDAGRLLKETGFDAGALLTDAEPSPSDALNAKPNDTRNTDSVESTDECSKFQLAVLCAFSDSGSEVDQLLWESLPLSVIEGMSILACAWQAATGFIALSKNEPESSEQAKRALRAAAEQNIITPSKADAPHSLSFLFAASSQEAESTAAPKTQEAPQAKEPLYLAAQPETFARIAFLLRAQRKASGKIIFLSGPIRHTGFAEIPWTTPLRTIALQMSGDIVGNRPFKAMQLGGDAGIILPDCLLNQTLEQFAPGSPFHLCCGPVAAKKHSALLPSLTCDDDSNPAETSTQNANGAAATQPSNAVIPDTHAPLSSLAAVTLPVPSTEQTNQAAQKQNQQDFFLTNIDSVEIMDTTSCMVRRTLACVKRLGKQSCGHCPACAQGLARMQSLLQNICEGKGTVSDLQELEQLAYALQQQTACAFGRSAVNPLLSTLLFFPEEYAAHLNEHRCPAGACPALTLFAIDQQACAGCDLCTAACPADAIRGQVQEKHSIDQDRCVSCGACRKVCRFNAVHLQRKE